MNKYCPYCGSDQMTVDADIRVTGTLSSNGRIVIKRCWDRAELTESANELSSKDLEGFCDECGEYCNFDWEKGFVKGDGIVER